VLVADALAAACVDVAPLPAGVQDRLRRVLPALAGTGNPVDAGAAVTADQFAAALEVLLSAPEVGAVVAVPVPTAVSDPSAGAIAGAAAAARAGAPIPVVLVNPAQAAAADRIELAGAPDGRFLLSVADAGTAARALAVAVRRRAWLARPRGPATAPDGVDVRSARLVVAEVLSRAPVGDWLLPPETDRLCRAAGLATVPTVWAPTPRAAVDAATRLGFPLVVKGHVAGVLHKGDAGLLRLPVTDADEVGRTVTAWAAGAGRAWLGAVVQPLVAPGDEFLVGAVRDPAAGPVVALGAGGRAADALGHRVHRLAPPTDADVAELLSGTGLLDTEHGRTLDSRGIADAVRRVGWLADALPEIAEIEVNPLVVTRSETRALDVRVREAPVPPS
jgi:acyl-CoA synthetase (NDP forming)